MAENMSEPQAHTVQAKLTRWLIILVLLILHAGVLIYYGVAIADLLKFCLTVLFCSLIPGLLILSLGRLYENDSFRFPMALAVGICLDIIIYIGLSILNAKYLIVPVFLLLFLVFIFKIRNLSELKTIFHAVHNLPTRHFTGLSASSVLLLIILIAFQLMPNPLPGNGQPLMYYVDQPWHLGNIAEIKNHWYPQDPRLAGYPFYYHIFFYVFTAFIAEVSSLSLPVLYFRLNAFFLMYLLFFAVYFSASRWFNNRTVGIIHIFTYFIGGTALLSYPFNIFLINLFTSPTFLLAVILFLFLIVELRAFLKRGETSRLVLIGLLVMGVSGAKGSFFPLILGGLSGCWAYCVWVRDEHRRLDRLLMISMPVFALVFIYIFNGIGGEGIKIAPFELIEYTRLYELFREYLGKGKWVVGVVIPVYFFAFFSFRSLALINLLKKIADLPNRRQFENLFITLVIIASFVTGYLLSYRGRSQYFYLFVGYICLNLIAAGYIYELFRKKHQVFLKAILLVLMVASAVDTTLTVKEQHQLIPELKVVDYKPLTPDLYEGLTYLREHSDKDAVIAAYRAFIYSNDNPAFFYYSAFSERRIIVEGWKYMSDEKQYEAQKRYEAMAELYNTRDREVAAAILREYSIDYLIMDKLAGQNLWFDTNELLVRQFQNDEVEIFQRMK